MALVARSRLLTDRSSLLWTLLTSSIALLIFAPILVILSSLLIPTPEVWQHLISTVLTDYITSTLCLMAGVSLCTIAIGVSTAWLVTLCRFPSRRLLQWALLLPLAAPAYILAYVYTELLEFYGPVQTTLRHLFGWTSIDDYWFPPIRSLGGAILIISLVLYPYIYLLARVAFLEQATCITEASRSLGCNPWQSFRRVALPLARPAIVSGLALVLMETLNDFGTVQYFAVNTLSVGIYRTWFGMNERIAACQLAALALGFIFLLICLERHTRRRARYDQIRQPQPTPYSLSGVRAIAAALVCWLPILLGFALPASRLLQTAFSDLTQNFSQRFWQLASHSLTLSLLTSAIAVLLAVLLAYGVRLQPIWPIQTAVQTAALGYAVPGTVIAVGILFPIGAIDNAIDRWMQASFGISTGLLLSGTLTALIFAYLVRFLAVSFNTVESSLQRISPNLDSAARSLGQSPSGILRRIHAPLMRSGLLTAAILVFVDVMKELPATLIVRPFNFDTLAVEVYRLAADERLAEAAAPALAIVAVGILPVILLSRQIDRTSRSA